MMPKLVNNMKVMKETGRYVQSVDIVLNWNDGNKAKITGKTAKRAFLQNLGWNICRLGFRIMLGRRNWETKINPPA